MKTTLTAIALAATLAQPAAAITFAELTTIYVGSGVFDSGHPTNQGTATVVTCSNVSGQAALVRFLVLDNQGIPRGNKSLTLQHGHSAVVPTHLATAYFESEVLSTSALETGAVINIESTQSGVFCTAVVVDAAAAAPFNGWQLPLTRVNPHPGTQ